jgi:methionyl aminopeptidase
MVHLKSSREIEIDGAPAGRILAAHPSPLLQEPRAVRAISTWDLDTIADESFIRSQHAGASAGVQGALRLSGFGLHLDQRRDRARHPVAPSASSRPATSSRSTSACSYERYFHTDSAWTYAVGPIAPETQRLMDVTEASLHAGIAAATLGNHVGDIGAAVEAVVVKAGFTVVRDLVGHGVGANMHEDPQVPNHGKPKRGPKLQEGMTIAIEPMVNAGGAATKTLSDKWTIVTLDGSMSAHFEHTIAITGDGPRILTTLG